MSENGFLDSLKQPRTKSSMNPGRRIYDNSGHIILMHQKDSPAKPQRSQAEVGPIIHCSLFFLCIFASSRLCGKVFPNICDSPETRDSYTPHIPIPDIFVKL
ncbi:hypothetical protein BH20ACI2_BH20ACI2_14660 [soil metagenome]